MEFFATGGFQQLYSDLADDDGCLFDVFYDTLEGTSTSNHYEHQLQYQRSSTDISLINTYNDPDYYTLDNNNNNNNQLSDNDGVVNNIDDYSSQEFSDWEQQLLENFIEIPDLIDFLPERTPLCTEMCDDFLHESNTNLRLATAPLSSGSLGSSQSEGSRQEEEAEAEAEEEKEEEKSTKTSGGYMCTFGSCDKLYAKPAHLKAHLRRHLGEKPYACQWPNCTWRFSRSDELARHRRSHSGVKPYKCDYCAKCFARSDHLTKHRKVHERRLLAASRAGHLLPNGQLPHSVFAVRPGRKRKNQL